LIQSGVLYRPSSPSEGVGTVIENLVNLYLKKSWLREPATKALCSLIPSLPQLTGGRQLAVKVVDAIESKGLAKNQDGVALYLVLHEFFEHMARSTAWKHGYPLDPANETLLFRALNEIPNEDTSSNQSGSSKAQPHFVWSLVCQQYKQRPRSTKMIKFSDLWHQVVENKTLVTSLLMTDGLFAESASLGRKFRGFQIFSTFLPELNEHDINYLFTPNFLRCLINQSSSGDRYLNKAAKRVVLSQ
jgi:DNA polymerase phi